MGIVAPEELRAKAEKINRAIELLMEVDIDVERMPIDDTHLYFDDLCDVEAIGGHGVLYVLGLLRDAYAQAAEANERRLAR